MEKVTTYYRSDIYLVLILSPTLVLGVWALSILAGAHRQGLLEQGFAIFIVASVPIIIVGLVGRGWSKYVTWAVRKYALIEIEAYSVYQIFVYALAPLLLKVFLFVLPFPISNYIGSWIPLWIVILQCLGLVKLAEVSWVKALIIVLIPLLVLIAIASLLIVYSLWDSELL